MVREIDGKLVPPHWHQAVYANAEQPEGTVDRDAYVVCVLEQLFRALKRRDVFASPSHSWSDPRARLLMGAGQEAQQESLETSVVKDCAAILIPSAMVRYGDQRFATWSTVMPASRM